MRLLACVLAALAVAAPASAAPIDEAAAYLASRQQGDGGFAEPGGRSSPSLTAWVVLGLAAAGVAPQGAGAYLADKPYPTATDLELRILALDALGIDVAPLASRLQELVRENGAIGPALNSTIWGALALRTVGRPVGRETVRYLLAAQSPNGGFAWRRGVAPDADDTAAAVQALVASGVSARTAGIRRALAYLRSLQNGDGGFPLAAGQASNAQSTAWAIQAFLAAGQEPGQAAFSYLERLQRRDGSFRLSARFVTTPVWVTSYVLAALARRPFPLS